MEIMYCCYCKSFYNDKAYQQISTDKAYQIMYCCYCKSFYNDKSKLSSADMFSIEFYEQYFRIYRSNIKYISPNSKKPSSGCRPRCIEPGHLVKAVDPNLILVVEQYNAWLLFWRSSIHIWCGMHC